MKDKELPITGFGEKKGNQFGLREVIHDIEATGRRAKAWEVTKELVRAYEVCATMKDLDAAICAWMRIIEKLLEENEKSTTNRDHST